MKPTTIRIHHLEPAVRAIKTGGDVDEAIRRVTASVRMMTEIEADDVRRRCYRLAGKNFPESFPVAIDSH